jgi:hypothetical protein
LSWFDSSVLLYSSSEAPERERKPDPNTYEPFRVVGDAVGRRLEAFMTEDEEGDTNSGLAGGLARLPEVGRRRGLQLITWAVLAESTSLVTALAKALCCATSSLALGPDHALTPFVLLSSYLQTSTA